VTDMTRLMRAVGAVKRATDSRGLLVRICEPMDIFDVRAKMLYFAASLQVDNFHLGEDLKPSKKAESNSAHNLALLAELLAAHLELETEIEHV
jgi:hypothetical protein